MSHGLHRHPLCQQRQGRPQPDLRAAGPEAARVLRPGGTYCGTDSRLSLRFRLLHVGDTMNVVDASTLPERLQQAGFEHVEVRARPKERVEFQATKPRQAGLPQLVVSGD